MPASCGQNFSKCIMIAFNILFLIFGLVILLVGILAVSFYANKEIKTQTEDGKEISVSIHGPMYSVIGMGCFITIVAFCGCCGAIRENKIMLMIYIILVGIVILFQIVEIIVVAVFKNHFNKLQNQVLKMAISLSYTEDNKDQNRFVDDSQEANECCGIDGWQDWQSSTWYKEREKYSISYQEVPPSCCPPKYSSNLRACYNEQTYYKKGCKEFIASPFDTIFLIIIGVIVGIFLFEVMMFIVSICLYLSLREPQAQPV